MTRMILITALALGTPLAAWADLPGLPPAAPGQAAPAPAQALPAVPAGDVRGADAPRPVTVTQVAPIRGSLFRQGAVAATPVGADGQPLLGAPAAPVSLIAVQPPQPRKYKKNDILTIIVRQDSQSTTNGSGKAKKSQDFDFGIEQFLQLALSSSGIPSIGNVGDSSKLPEIKFKYANDRQADASQARQDSLSLRISGTVVDVKPNGTMVVEATAHITVDKEEQLFRLSGVCRVEDLTVDNTILSTQLADLTISKQTRGEVRDGTKRGWLNQFIDKVSPF
jgi:flagellar L-ring protein precursor FlgH